MTKPGPTKVLLVEDNPGDARLLQEYLRGIEENRPVLEWSETLSHALEVLPSIDPDLVLLDLGLPDAEGLAGLKMILSRAPLTPVVILTGMNDQELAYQAVAEGAQDFLVKGEVNAPILERTIRYGIERLGAWRAVQESEAKYQDLFENAPEMLATVDPQSGVILECNATLAAAMGCPKDELVGTGVLNLYHPRVRSRAEEAFRVFQETRKIAGEELELLTRSGETIPVSLSVTAYLGDNGEILYSRSSLRDISQRKEAEAALALFTEQLRLRSRISDIFLALDDDRAYQEVLELILEVARCPHGIMGTLNQEGNLVVRAMSAVAWDDCTIPDREVVLDRAHWGQSLLGRTMETGESEWSNEGPFRAPGGHLTLQRVMAAPILNQNQTVGLIAVANREEPFEPADMEGLEAVAAHLAPILDSRVQRDVQARKREEAEEELRALNLSLEDKVRARTEELDAANQELEAFAYSVSHDLRGPLRAIDGFARILGEEYGERLDDEGHRLLTIVRDNARRMGTLIDDLLEFSRVGRKDLRTQKVDMGRLVEAVAQDLGLGQKEWSGELEIGDLPHAVGDPHLLRQVWINLISNAVKFTGKEPNPTVRVRGWREGNQVVYEVADNGVGFDMTFADKLFGVFERLHRPDEFEGTGVGLALASRIVERHEGRMWGEGKVGEGATIRFSIPQLREGAE